MTTGPTGVLYNPDIMGLVFELIGNPFLNDNALKDLRECSEVCATWRHILLGTPHLWGRLIDLNFFNRMETSSWVGEMMRRSGSTAPLWVTGTMFPPDNFLLKNRIPVWKTDSAGTIRFKNLPLPSLRDFFSSLIANWSRVERFVVRVGIIPRVARGWFSDLLCLRSPALREFTFTLIQTTAVVDTISFPVLFSGHAPLLKALHLKNVEFDPHCTAQFRHLRSMVIHNGLTLSSITKVLEEHRHLESFEFSLNPMYQTASAFDVVFPPITSFTQLKHLSICGLDIDFCLRFFASTIFSPTCSLTISTMRFPTDYSDCSFDTWMLALCNLRETYSLAQKDVKLVVKLKDDRFWGKISVRLLFDGASLAISIPASAEGHLSVDIHQLPSPLLNLVNVCHLDLDLGWFFLPCLKQHQLYSNNCPQCGSLKVVLFKLILQLSCSAKVLTTTSRCLEQIIDLQPCKADSIVLLPAMRVLRLPTDWVLIPRLPAYLRFRQSSGCPLELLDFTVDAARKFPGRVTVGLPSSLQCLDEFAGLKIVWRWSGVEGVQQYVCRGVV